MLKSAQANSAGKLGQRDRIPGSMPHENPVLYATYSSVPWTAAMPLNTPHRPSLDQDGALPLKLANQRNRLVTIDIDTHARPEQPPQAKDPFNTIGNTVSGAMPVFKHHPSPIHPAPTNYMPSPSRWCGPGPERSVPQGADIVAIEHNGWPESSIPADDQPQVAMPKSDIQPPANQDVLSEPHPSDKLSTSNTKV